MKRSMLILTGLLFFYACSDQARINTGRFAFVTYVTDDIQERSVKAFIKSVRELGNDYSLCNIYVVVEDPEKTPCASLEGKGVYLLPLEMDTSLRAYPLAIKAFAAAQVEQLASDRFSTVAWFDPATLLLNSPVELDLMGRYSISVRPVTLHNTIGLKAGSVPDDFWLPLFNDLGLKPEKIPVVKTIADQTDILAYFNCEIFSFDPRAGICKKWKELLTKYLEDTDYQTNVCNTPRRRLFLHQAVLSGVIISEIPGAAIKSLPVKNAYPFNQHSKLNDSLRAKSLNELNAIIFDYAWERDSGWLERIPAEPPLKEWLETTYKEY